MRSATACFVACLALTARAGGIVDFGDADEFTLSQPVVQTQVGSFDTLLNEYLLDTGASGILVGAAASAELRGAGLQTVATYTDFGVAGPQATQVSRPYDFRFAGSNGVPLTLPGTRIQTSSGDFAFYSGIAGMPLMMNRTVGLDLAAQADMEALRIGVAFGSGPPPTAGRQYSVPLTMVEFPMTGQAQPTDPLPVSAPLPFLPVRMGSGTHRLDGQFLLDTGAQQCILSSWAAIGLGLDTNGNGTLDDEAESFQTVAAGSVLTLGSGVPDTVAQLANAGLLDVGTSRLTVRSGLSAGQVMAWISTGRNGGAWDGPAGVTSSAVAAALGRAVGWRANGDGSFTIAYSAAGDLDLNGVVDFDDVVAMVSAGRYDTGLPATWSQGDYDYNGVVDFDDVVGIVSAGLFDTGAYAAAPLQLGPLTAVPEPATWIAAASGAALAAAARRRGSR